MKYTILILALSTALSFAQSTVSDTTNTYGDRIDTAAEQNSFLTKLAGGTSISFTELGYLDGATSGLQSQLNLKLTSSNNLSDLPNASTARANLGLIIGSNVQAYSAILAGTTASFTTADETKVDWLTVTQAVNLDTLESDMATNNAKISNATHTGDVTGSTALMVVGLNGVNLSGLGTGILKNTTGTGVPSIAVAGTDYLTPTGSAANLISFPTFNQNTTGSAATLTTARNINGVAFDGSGDITVAAAAGTLTGVTLNASVTGSSLTSIGTITNRIKSSSGISEFPSLEISDGTFYSDPLVSFSVNSTSKTFLFTGYDSGNQRFAFTRNGVLVIGGAGITRLTPTSIGIGNGTLADTSGTLELADIVASGTLSVGSSTWDGAVISGDQLFTDEVEFTGMPKVGAYKSSDQTGLTTGAYNKITFDTEEFDTNNNFASSTFTAPFAGYVKVDLAIYASGTAGVDALAIYKNGSQVKRVRNATIESAEVINGSAMIQVSATDTLEIYYYAQNARDILGASSITWVNFTMIP